MCNECMSLRHWSDGVTACPVSLGRIIIIASCLLFLLDLAPQEASKCVAFRRAKEEAERKERQDRQLKAEASRAKKRADELKKKVTSVLCVPDSCRCSRLFA